MWVRHKLPIVINKNANPKLEYRVHLLKERTVCLVESYLARHFTFERKIHMQCGTIILPGW